MTSAGTLNEPYRYVFRGLGRLPFSRRITGSTWTPSSRSRADTTARGEGSSAAKRSECSLPGAFWIRSPASSGARDRNERVVPRPALKEQDRLGLAPAWLKSTLLLVSTLHAQK